MDWIFEHIWVVIAIASVIARLLMKRQQGETGERVQPPPKEYEFEDPELAERTRKIREEIQRKIAERRGQQAPPPVMQSAQQSRPAPVVRSPEATTPPVTLPQILREVLERKPTPAATHRPAATVNLAEESERQAGLMEKLKEAEIMKAAAQRRLAFEATTADKEPAVLLQARESVLDDLRNPQALRRAFVLREVLGPPVALR